MDDLPGPVLTLLSRGYCHLCEEMLQAVLRLRRARAFSVEVIDVDAQTELEERYGGRVPVLLAEGTELCHYRLDEDAVLAYLSRG